MALVTGLVVAYGAALTSLGLALATWVPRLGRAVGLCVAAHVGVTVGWAVFAILLTGGAPGLTGPGLASFSPFVGVVLPSAQMHMGKFSASEWNQVVGWVAFWTLADVALAAVLLKAVLVTFNRCLGRMDEVHAPCRPASRPARDPASYRGDVGMQLGGMPGIALASDQRRPKSLSLKQPREESPGQVSGLLDAEATTSGMGVERLPGGFK